jgi:hypothetical protein
MLNKHYKFWPWLNKKFGWDTSVSGGTNALMASGSVYGPVDLSTISTPSNAFDLKQSHNLPNRSDTGSMPNILNRASED